MPVSEDELEHGYGGHMQQPQNIMSKAELRRSNKPIMEKRRRARINHCLNELKTIILDAMQKDPARHSKLEKADILEMTVKHLQTIQRQQLTLAVNSDPNVVQKFQCGFNECAGEVSRYIGRMEGVETGVKQRLVSHLASCVNGLQQMSPFTAPTNPSSTQSSSVNEDVNNNTASARLQMMTGLQLIPSRLPTGELALLLPNSQHLPFFPSLENQVSTTTESPKSSIKSNSVDRSHNSAFTAVKKDDKFFRSPLPSPTSTTASSYGDDSCDQPYPSPSHLPEVTSSTSEHPRKTFDSSFSSYLKNPQNESQSLLQIAPQPLTNLNNDSATRIPQFISNNIKTVQKPLTVITSNEMLKEHPQKFVPLQPQTNFKDPLDFSLKKEAFQTSTTSSLFKRPYQEDPPDRFIKKSTEFQPPLKVQKLLSESQSRNIQLQERKSLFEIQNNDPKLSNENQFLINNQMLPARRNSFEVPNQPSTSSADSSESMWRPW